jgi:hypothetical protein
MEEVYIREMSATQAEWWAIRAILAMANNGINLPDNLSDMGMAGMAKVGLEMVAKNPSRGCTASPGRADEVCSGRSRSSQSER